MDGKDTIGPRASKILDGVKYYDEIKDKLVLNNKELRSLTYRPELIRLYLPFIEKNVCDVYDYNKKFPHPLLHELVHQSNYALFFDLIDDPEFDQARENLYFFLKELRKIAPQFFYMKDKYAKLPIQRFEPNKKHINNPNIKKMFSLLYPFNLTLTKYYKYGVGLWSKDEFESNAYPKDYKSLEEFEEWCKLIDEDFDTWTKPTVLKHLEEYNFSPE